MNKDADAYADSLTFNGEFFEPAEGDYDASVNLFGIKEAILRGMQWAYDDAADISRSLSDEIGEEIARAIEARAK